MTANAKTLLLAGATGAVGQQILTQALSHASVHKVVALTRRPLPVHPKLINPIVDFSNLDETADWWQVDAVLCALGTTIKIAGSAEAFRQVDLAMPSNLANAAAKNNVKCFVLNSSMMANDKASGLYLKTKGEAENAVKNAGFASVVIARPGLLDAQRQERRIGEEFGLFFSRLANPLLPRRFRSVPVASLARVMLTKALEAPPGITILESEAFQTRES